MGIYHCEKADADAIVLRHEGEDDHTVEVHAGISGAAGSGAFAPVPGWLLAQVQEGKRYTVTFYASEFVTYPAPAPAEPVAEVPAWAVKPDAARTIPSATEPGQVDQLASSPQEAQDGAESAQAGTESDGPSEAASAAPAAPDEAEEPAAE